VSDQVRDYAKKSLKKKSDFKQYLFVYLAVTIIVLAVYLLTSPGAYFWPGWVIFGMGVGALFAGLDAYGLLSGKPITDSDIDAEVERLNRKG
jgi:hypothetical protein